MLTCDNCGFEDAYPDGGWNYKEEGETIDPPILIVECPDCAHIVDTRVEL